MLVLVDYNNISESIRKNGPKYTLEQITTALNEKTKNFVPITRINFRLYGGWYGQTALTKEAQKLSTDLQREFPYVFKCSLPEKTIKMQAELAYALISAPKKHLLHTYREKQRLSSRFKVKKTSEIGCTNSPCALDNIKSFIKKGKCPGPACVIMIEDVILNAEQKLVDVMLTSDLLHIVYNNPKSFVVIVSSDEDFLPAIVQALNYSKNVIHVQAKKDRKTPSYYRSILGSHYLELSISDS